MVSRSYLPAIWEYYQNVKDRLINTEGYRYRFRDEDFYIYLMVHAYKHHSKGGYGVRHLMDIQVYLNTIPSLDWEYIHREFEQLGIADYAMTVRNLAQKLFDKECRIPEEIITMLRPDELELLSASIGAGTYGTLEMSADNSVKKFKQGRRLSGILKIKYLWERLTWEPGLQSDFPRLAKYKVLHPLLYIGRAIKIVFLRRRYLLAEIKSLNKD